MTETAGSASQDRPTAAELVLQTRYMYDAEFHAAVHTYAIRARGGTSWRVTLADMRAVADLEAAGLGWTNHA